MTGSAISITDGVDAVVDQWLDVEGIGRAPHYKHRSAALRLSGGPRTPRHQYDLIAAMLVAIERAWTATRVTSMTRPSKENWRFARQLQIAPHNTSPEVTLERAVAALSGDWANQVPTASGLSGATRDRARNLDLVHRDAVHTYTWYELKVASDTPVYAAIEILLRGLLYLFTRRHLAELKYDAPQKEVLRARVIQLRVLAPAAYYAGLDLRWLEAALNDGLTRYLAGVPDLDIAMDFAFLAFPLSFAWPCDEDVLRRALAQITRAYQQV